MSEDGFRIAVASKMNWTEQELEAQRDEYLLKLWAYWQWQDEEAERARRGNAY